MGSELKDKVAIVTGASRGLGRMIAAELAKAGARVVIAARTETVDRLPGTIYETAEAITAAGGTALPVRCDVTSEESVAALVEKTLAELGRIDILVNNAGTAFPRPVIETPLKRWELVLRVNLTGAFLCSKAVLPSLMERGGGSIVNITSIDATTETSGFTGAAYGVSKAALDRFTRSLAGEVREHGIAVNALRPREGIATEGLLAVSGGSGEEHWDPPERFLRAALFLAGQQAGGGVTGVVASDEEYFERYGLE